MTPALEPSPPLLGRLTSPVLVGREHELALILQTVAIPPALVFVEGEAGVGKTRLLEELLGHARLAGRQQRVGRCVELSEPFPLGPVIEALRDAAPPADLPPLVGALRPLLPELAAALPPEPPPIDDRRAERHRAFRAFRELLARLGPAVLVLEDLHWADRATLDFLSFLAAQLPANLSLVCTYRCEELAGASPLVGLETRVSRETTAVRVALTPLDRARVRELVATILEASDVSDAFAGYLFERTGGLPFAVEEVLLLLKQRQELVNRRGAWVRQELEELGVPAELGAAIRARLRGLGADAQRVVEAAAIVVEPADEQLLAEVAGLDARAAGGALTAALESALLLETPAGRFGFRHPLAREAIEAAIPVPRARRMHLRAAGALEAARKKPHARLAYHYRAAGETRTWIRHAEAAAKEAVSLNDHAAAYALLAEAVSVEELGPAQRARLAVKLAQQAASSHVVEPAIDLLRGLLREREIPRALVGELGFWLGRLYEDAGDPARAIAAVQQALPDLRGLARARALGWLCSSPSHDAPIEQRLEWSEEAWTIARDSTGDRAARIGVAADRAAILLGVGDPRGWQAIEEVPKPGRNVRERRHFIRGHGNFADAVLHLGHYRAAEALNRESLDLAHREAPVHAPAFEMNRLQLDWLAGRWQELEQQLVVFGERVEDWPVHRRESEALLGLLALAQGRTRRALELLEPYLTQPAGDQRILTWVAAGIARLRLSEGDAGAAAEAARRGLQAVQTTGGWVWGGELLPVAVEALLAEGRREQAAELADHFAGSIAGRDAPAAQAALLTCRALLAEKARAAALHLEAHEAWQRLPRPYEAARELAAAGRGLLADEPDRGRELSRRALEELERLGAAWDADDVRRTLREHGAPLTSRRGRKSYGDELSPRERRVAELAVEGLSNREIAATLYVTVKTVEAHMTSAHRKLGVRSRPELVARLKKSGV